MWTEQAVGTAQERPRAAQESAELSEATEAVSWCFHVTVALGGGQCFVGELGRQPQRLEDSCGNHAAALLPHVTLTHGACRLDPPALGLQLPIGVCPGDTEAAALCAAMGHPRRKPGVWNALSVAVGLKPDSPRSVPSLGVLLMSESESPEPTPGSATATTT